MSLVFTPASTNSYAFSAANLAAMAGASKVTVAAWLKCTFDSADGFLFEYNQPWVTNTTGSLVLDPNSGTTIAVGGSGSVGLNYRTAPRPTTSAWHHHLMEYDLSASGLELVGYWIDGAAQTLSGGATSDNTNTFSAALFTVGCRWNGSTATQRINGTIDDVAIWVGTLLGTADRALVYNSHPNNAGLSVQPNYYWPCTSDGTATLGGINLTLGSAVTSGAAHPNPSPGTFVAVPSSLAAFPAIHVVPGGSASRPTEAYDAIELDGTGTNWPTGSTSNWSISNSGCSVTLNNQYVVGPQKSLLFVDPGVATGTLTVIDGTGAPSITVPIAAAAATPYEFAGVGDSLTVEATSGPSYPNRMAVKLGKAWKVHNLGVGGRTIDNFPWTSTQQANPDNLAASYNPSATLFVVGFGGCLNDLNTGSPPSTATLYGKFKTHVAASKALGANVRVIVWTTPPCDTGIGLASNPSINQNILDFNAAVRSGYTSGDLGAHVLIDHAADPRWSNPATGYNGTYIQAADFTHWMPPVKESLADKMTAACNLLAGGGGAIPGSTGTPGEIDDVTAQQVIDGVVAALGSRPGFAVVAGSTASAVALTVPSGTDPTTWIGRKLYHVPSAREASITSASVAGTVATVGLAAGWPTPSAGDLAVVLP